jgi:hypothetical protein
VREAASPLGPGSAIRNRARTERPGAARWRCTYRPPQAGCVKRASRAAMYAAHPSSGDAPSRVPCAPVRDCGVNCLSASAQGCLVLLQLPLAFLRSPWRRLPPTGRSSPLRGPASCLACCLRRQTTIHSSSTRQRPRPPTHSRIIGLSAVQRAFLHRTAPAACLHPALH